ncbi:MAG: A1 family peptidase [Myxococcales bacterium]|nr:A1 family peptidase [Myxococcales bacterium]
MANHIKIPISNVLMGGDYTGVIVVGATATPLNVILDTGSSSLAIDGHAFDPLTAPDTRTTNLLQTVSYGAGGWIGAVVQTSVGLAAEVTLPGVHVAVTYAESPNMFGGAQGILGLAYAPLDRAYQMPADTWQTRYHTAQLGAGTAVDLAPYFTQLEQAGVVHNKFGFYVKRSTVSAATDDPGSDPLNHGYFVIGGGEEATDLYTGAFTHVEVLHDVWYSTNLVGVQVGAQPMIPVAPVAAGSPLASNSIVDSGTNMLLFDQPVYDAIVAAFQAIDPAFATALRTHAVGPGAGLDQTELDLAAWPDLHLMLQGADGAPATLTVTPSDYWQLDANRKGAAVAYLGGDGGSQGGRSILGLPLFTGYYTVFDRSLDGGRGAIKFAPRA